MRGRVRQLAAQVTVSSASVIGVWGGGGRGWWGRFERLCDGVCVCMCVCVWCVCVSREHLCDRLYVCVVFVCLCLSVCLLSL